MAVTLTRSCSKINFMNGWTRMEEFKEKSMIDLENAENSPLSTSRLSSLQKSIHANQYSFLNYAIWASVCMLFYVNLEFSLWLLLQKLFCQILTNSCLKGSVFNMEDVRMILQNFTRTTSSHGIPQIGYSRSVKYKIFWAIICCIGLSVFTNQAMALIQKYLRGDKVVNVEVSDCI